MNSSKSSGGARNVGATTTIHMVVCPDGGGLRKRPFVALNEAHNVNDASGSIIINPFDENIPDWLIEGVHVRLESGEIGVIKAALFGMATVELEQDSSVSYTTSYHNISLAIPDLRDNIIITRGCHVALEGELVSRDLDMTVTVQLFDNTIVSCRFENIAKRHPPDDPFWARLEEIDDDEEEGCEATIRRVSFEEDPAINVVFENEGGIPPPDDPFWARVLPLDDAISKATFYLNKTMDVTRRCGHGPITQEKETAYNKIVQGALMFLKRFHFHITNETGCCGFVTNMD